MGVARFLTFFLPRDKGAIFKLRLNVLSSLNIRSHLSACVQHSAIDRCNLSSKDLRFLGKYNACHKRWSLFAIRQYERVTADDSDKVTHRYLYEGWAIVVNGLQPLIVASYRQRTCDF